MCPGSPVALPSVTLMGAGALSASGFLPCLLPLSSTWERCYKPLRGGSGNLGQLHFFVQRTKGSCLANELSD